MEEHRLLEKEIAEFIGQEDAMIFSSGYGTNTGVLGCLLGKKDIALVDTFVHMSVTEGLLNTNIKTIGHNDLDYLEMTLKKVQDEYITKLVIIDGAYSQDGDIAQIPEILQVCRKYGALLMVDDAHGIGVFGETGRGVIEHYEILGQVDIVTGTLSKSFGSVGGFVGASKNTIRYIKWYAKTSIFSAAITPQATASSREALRIMKTDPSYREKLWKNVHYLKKCLLENGFDIKNTVSPIFPIMVRDNYKVKKIAAMLLKSGIYAVGICYPAVSRKDARIRASVLSTHEFQDLDNLVQNLVKIDKALSFR